MILSNLVMDALTLAIIVHGKQKDKLGLPYILYPIAVANDDNLKTEQEQIVALLHDVLEDTAYFYNDLIDRFGSEISQAVWVTSKKKGEALPQYYDRVKANPLALKVKECDIRHNCSHERLKYLSSVTQARLVAKYERARLLLGIN